MKKAIISEINNENKSIKESVKNITEKKLQQVLIYTIVYCNKD
jgi:hypothetical protein